MYYCQIVHRLYHGHTDQQRQTISQSNRTASRKVRCIVISTQRAFSIYNIIVGGGDLSITVQDPREGPLSITVQGPRRRGVQKPRCVQGPKGAERAEAGRGRERACRSRRCKAQKTGKTVQKPSRGGRGRAEAKQDLHGQTQCQSTRHPHIDTVSRHGHHT